MRKYYSARTGKNKNFSGFDLKVLKRLFFDLYSEFEENGYFQEHFGYHCVDQGYVSGKLGENIEAKIYRLMRKDKMWPIKENIDAYSEDDVFDMIEFLHDHVSSPIETPGAYHPWNQCGWHYSEFDRNAGRIEFALKINEILEEYGAGFAINANGLILIKENSGLANIHDASIPTERDNVKTKIDLAVQKYLGSRNDLEERRIAIRELADILEMFRKDAKKYLNGKDEADLFSIANNFAIRHANEKQKIQFDRDIWYSWIFYNYLSTIHALLRIKERDKRKNKKAAKGN